MSSTFENLADMARFSQIRHGGKVQSLRRYQSGRKWVNALTRLSANCDVEPDDDKENCHEHRQ